MKRIVLVLVAVLALAAGVFGTIGVAGACAPASQTGPCYAQPRN